MTTHRILLTGGTGFFGKSILDARRRGLLPIDTELTILARHPEQFLTEYPEFRNAAKFIAGDIRDFAFPRGRFDALIHAAAPAVTGLPPGEMRSIILDGAKRVAAYARTSPPARILYISSGAVYGVQPPGLEGFPEDFPCAPVTEYGIAKLEAEHILLDSGIPTVIARCFAFVGPYLNFNIHFAIGNFIRDALAAVPLRIQGDGTPLRSYLDSDDLVRWLFGLLERGEPGTICNVGSDRAITIRDLAETVRHVLRPELPVEIACPPRPGTVGQRYIPDISRAGEFGLAQTVSLEDAIRRAAGMQSETDRNQTGAFHEK